VDDKGRTLVNVKYSLANTMEKHIQLTRVTHVPIPQHACARPPKRKIPALLSIKEQTMTQQDHHNVDLLGDRNTGKK
jgi:hypothetical protein